MDLVFGDVWLVEAAELASWEPVSALATAVPTSTEAPNPPAATPAASHAIALFLRPVGRRLLTDDELAMPPHPFDPL
ncbi:hypothetical protein ACTXG7_10080 [Mycolicibacterium sp. Dal123E01]|uniref:hypothetical protein n=1 Tax=Mycolicibacterium sp. Dal123E01 TaxID=3457578 RepID=UPI00403EAC84